MVCIAIAIRMVFHLTNPCEKVSYKGIIRGLFALGKFYLIQWNSIDIHLVFGVCNFPHEICNPINYGFVGGILEFD